MRPESALRGCMIGLVLLNLVFVQMTGAAGLHWLVPLYVLTLAAPLLARIREYLAYRIAWNAGVLALFAVLVRHAMRADLAFVLEQGLVLAAFCQVHLLNNLRASQRPDLLFFNAFLIAIIAAFMTTGANFPIVFLLFAPCFVIGLQLLSAARDGSEPGGHAERVPSSETRSLVADGTRRAAATLALSLLVFVFWPRNFERKAFFHGRIEFSSGPSPDELEVGFSETLDLEQTGRVAASDKPALEVTLVDGKPLDVPALWRGATLGSTDGSGWQAFSPLERHAAAHADDGWRFVGHRWLRKERAADSTSNLFPVRRGRAADVTTIDVEVVRLDPATQRFFVPLGAQRVEVIDEDVPARANVDGTFETLSRGTVRYGLTLELAQFGEEVAGVPLAGARYDSLPDELRPYVDLPSSPLLTLATDLATNLAAPLARDVAQHELVSHLTAYLERTYEYAPPGTEDAARSLDEFLRGEAPGHCEFFASALGTMLRSVGVPCRVVTGLRSTRWSGRTLHFALRDAHAWVEVHDPAAGWYAVDPSPFYIQDIAGESLWARMQSGVRSAWGSVTGFDPEKRAEFLAWMRTLPARTARLVREQPLTSISLPLLLALFVLYKAHRRRSAVPPALRHYRRALRVAKLTLEHGETPRELLTRARGIQPALPALAALEAATSEHEARRYRA